MICNHANTEIWEPHLAGARKCMDCGRVKNPNLGEKWFYEKRKPKESDFFMGFVTGFFVSFILVHIILVLG